MKIDSAIKDFFEKYDREAIQSIDRLSKDFTLNHAAKTLTRFPAININEGFEKFDNYLRGYAAYKIKSLNDPKAMSQEAIRRSVNKFFESQPLFETVDIPYSNIPGLISGYVEGVNKLLNTIDEVKGSMIDAGVALESVGEVNDISDKFVDKLNEVFYPLVEKSLWASGYNAKKRLISVKKNEPPVKKTTFV